MQELDNDTADPFTEHQGGDAPRALCYGVIGVSVADYKCDRCLKR